MSATIHLKQYKPNTYTVFNPDPDYPGFINGVIDDKGKVLEGSDKLALVIDQIQRGIGNKKALAVRCAPNIPRVKKKDMTTLGKLFAPQNFRGKLNKQNLKPIPEKDRYKGRDWEKDRRPIKIMDDKGFSVTQMAKELGVTKQALSAANKRYSLYQAKPNFRVFSPLDLT